jgi:pimeloyl-ACP methyl ester carboxylesterase
MESGMENVLARRRGYGWGRILREIFLGSGLMLALLSMIGAVYQWISERRDMQLYPPPGQMVEVGGYRLHLNCSGAGSPTVILDGGADAVSLQWFKVQPEVAKFTRVCSYDRAGFGWSDLAPTIPYVDENARRLHTLLTNAGVPSPFVLVGQSYGGLIVRMFEHQYPEVVSGAVLVDSMHENQFARVGAAESPSPVWETGVGRRSTRRARRPLARDERPHSDQRRPAGSARDVSGAGAPHLKI